MGEDYTPQRVEATFRASFQIREVVWCEFEEAPNARVPEFLGNHPCVIISTKNSADLPHLVVPITSKDQAGNEYAYALTRLPFRNKPFSWVVCSHIYSVAHSRLRRPRPKIRMYQEDFDHVIRLCHSRLPVVRAFESP